MPKLPPESDLKSLVRTTFVAAMSRHLPFMRHWPDSSVPSLLLCYSWPSDQLTRIFVGLLLAKYDARFTLECGWVHDGLFPAHSEQYWYSIRTKEGHLGPPAPTSAGVRFRLGELDYPAHDTWWQPIARRGTLQVDETVSQALDTFTRKALPFISEHSGLTLPETHVAGA